MDRGDHVQHSIRTVGPVIRADLGRRSTPNPADDAGIAALAFQHDLVLLMRDRLFESVPRAPRR